MVCLGSPHRNAVPIHYQWLLFFIFLPLLISTQCMVKSPHALLLGGLLKQRLFHKTVYLQSVLSIDTRQSSSLHLIALQLTAVCCPYARPPTPPPASIGDRGEGWDWKDSWGSSSPSSSSPTPPGDLCIFPSLWAMGIFICGEHKAQSSRYPNVEF